MNPSDAGPVADLHVHTTVSDGTLELGEIPRAAHDAGLSAVAVTDHDRIHPAFDEPVVEHDGILLIQGIELKVEWEDGQRFDLLGYALRETDELRDITDRIQEDRVVRAQRMIDRLETHLGITLAIDVSVGIGRPHIARAVARHPETTYGYDEVFDALIGDGKPCHVSRWVPSFETGRIALERACRLVALAHPLRYENVEAALDVAKTVGGVERWYPYDTPKETGMLDDVIEANELIPTGGSDAHGRELGIAGPDRDAFERIADRCDLR